VFWRRGPGGGTGLKAIALALVSGAMCTAEVDTMTQRMETFSKAGDLASLAALGREIEEKWKVADVSAYADLTQHLCRALLNADCRGNRQQLGLAQTFAMRALAVSDRVPLETEWQLLWYVRSAVDEAGKKVSGDAWAVLRERQAKLWLHAWKRLVNAMDRNWDPRDVPAINLASNCGLPSGVSPEAIRDPDARAKYEAAIEANRKKAEEYNKQDKLRSLGKRFLPLAERTLVQAYRTPPRRNEELRKHLRAFLPDGDVEARILSAVQEAEPLE